jgi:hypothetical protein
MMNEVRGVFGPAGNLLLLKFLGRDAVPQFEVKATPTGWGADTATGQDGADTIALEIADVDNSLSALLDPASGEVTHFSLGGTVYKLEPDQTKRPIKAPLVWKLRGYATNETWT